MKKTPEELYTPWFVRAEDDEQSARAVIKDGAPSTACFLAQQMAEKLLKGLLVYFGKEFPKVHDLLVLETLLLEDAPDISKLHEDLVILNSYYIETRYPGDYPEFTENESRTAFESALRVKKFVQFKTKR